MGTECMVGVGTWRVDKRKRLKVACRGIRSPEGAVVIRKAWIAAASPAGVDHRKFAIHRLNGTIAHAWNSYRPIQYSTRHLRQVREWTLPLRVQNWHIKLSKVIPWQLTATRWTSDTSGEHELCTEDSTFATYIHSCTSHPNFLGWCIGTAQNHLSELLVIRPRCSRPLALYAVL